MAAVALWPLPGNTSVPLYLIAFLPLVLGVVVGGVAGWLAGGRQRRLARRRKRRIEDLESELNALRARLAPARTPEPPAAGAPRPAALLDAR